MPAIKRRLQAPTSPGRVRSRVLACLVVLLLPLPDAPLQAEEPARHEWSANSVNELYAVTIGPETGKPLIGKMHRWVINVTTLKGEPVYPARISVGGGMEGHGHGLPTQPQVVAYGGNGDYLIDGVRFNMEGEWRLSFIIDSETGSDRVDFDLIVEF